MCDVAERLENRGRVEGREEGGIQELLGLVQDGLLDRDIAADRAERHYGVKRDEFRRMLSTCDPKNSYARSDH